MDGSALKASEEKINWNAVREAAEKHFGREFSTNYLQNIYHKRLTSKKIKEWLDNALNDDAEKDDAETTIKNE